MIVFQDLFWQTLFWLYILATLVQLVAWWCVFGKLGRGVLDVGRWTLDAGSLAKSITHLPVIAVSSAKVLTEEEAKEGRQSPFTIIICARNEAENLRRHLPAVLAQEFGAPWELLVVDDASEDETPDVLQFFLEKNPERMRVLRITEKSSPGKKQALSHAIAAAKYDHLLLTDADCEPASRRWLVHMAAALTARPETEIVLGYGPNFAGSDSGQTTLSRQTTASTSSDDSKSSDEYAKKNTDSKSSDEYAKNRPNLTTFKKLSNFCAVGLWSCSRVQTLPPCVWSNFYAVGLWSRYETAFVAAQYFSFALAGMPYMGVGRNLAFKRPIFDRVGGFAAHAHIPSGDDDLLVNAAANAKNTAVCLAPESFVYSEAPHDLRAWLRQKRRHLAAGQVYRWPHKIALAILGLSHVGHYLLFAVLVCAGFNLKIIAGIFFLRLFTVLFVFGKILRVLREPGLSWRIPLFDVLLAAYYGTVAPWFLISGKSVGWEREKGRF